MTDLHARRNSLIPSVTYKNPRAALAWLERAFGFEPALIVADDKGEIGHAEMRHDDCSLSVGGEWSDVIRSPLSTAGKNTQTVRVHLRNGIDAHCERARAAGAVILQEPAEQFYGDRTYRAQGPEGHVWSFSQSGRTPDIAEMEKASGLKFELTT